MPPNIVIFAGPTTFGTGLTLRSNVAIEWRPPVKRGDIEALLKLKQAPTAIAIVDGTFHSYPAVGHVEIRSALNAGWLIYGLCSMGAIRAAELRHLGMRPWGRIAKQFCTDPDFRDDEVALLHEALAPYRPISEPLVHIREFLSQMLAKQTMTEEQVQAVLQHLCTIWYGFRTLPRVSDLLGRLLYNPDLLRQARTQLANFHRFRSKQSDLVEFVEHRPWETLAT
jgi:TfuA protein